ncbi:2-oxoglutarate-dependent dioxygenase 21, chloroplastic-like [Coffea arabica]|uniref:2-oxoglutarate-dependent dioxygenase 21, chloroplastic-like n=1 Tax=Coffea arabica TaxID=13443 RepID=A0A6P6TWB6_COFAR|nr:flavanone 3-dioxygenase 3-like [Coffea arabica]
MSSISDHNPIHAMKVPIIDLSHLSRQDFYEKSLVIKEIHEACQNSGVFHVINHGIPKSVIDEALEVNQKFFDLPGIMKEEILELGSRDPFSPVKLARFQHSALGSDLLQRDVLRLQAYPFEDFVDLWPKHPADYREKMGRYTAEIKKLAIQVFVAIMESLNLDATYLKENFEKGMQLVATNSYPSKSISDIKIGTPPHTDFGIITILVQTAPGLQVMDSLDGTWKDAPKLEGSLQVFVGDLLEVLSNGMYKSVMHQVIVPSTNKTRMSIASFHSFEFDEIVEPAKKLVDEEGVKRYRGCSSKELLKLIFSRALDRPIDALQI